MNDETNVTSPDADKQKSGESSAKVPKSYERRANSNLRQARRGLEAADWQEDRKSEHLMAEANVLALLDLADAIRGSRGGSNGAGGA